MTSMQAFYIKLWNVASKTFMLNVYSCYHFVSEAHSTPPDKMRCQAMVVLRLVTFH